MATDTAPKIPMTKSLLGPEEADAARQAVLSGWLTQGPRVAEFEQAIADYLGARHAIAVSSCTTALHLALVVVGVGPGDEVIVPSMSFIATANAVRHAGAEPIFAEINPHTYNLDPEAVEAALSPRTRAILPVHQLGMPVDLDRFRTLAERHGLALIENAADALGSEYLGKPVGGDSTLACFSFHSSKVITTGEGGVLTTSSDEYARRLRLLRQHATSIDDPARRRTADPAFEEYREVGYNCRMTDLQAAIGVEQMKRLDGIIARRRELASRYDQALRKVPGILTPFVPDYATYNCQSYAIRLTRDYPLGRNALMAALLRRGVASRRGVMTIHREPPYRGPRLPISEAADDESLLLPLFPQMTRSEQGYVIQAVQEIGEHADAQAGAA